jgi:Anti-sigma factor NepR
MIDQAKRGDEPSPEAGLEEARLRQQAIGVKLRQMFDEIVNEPVPDEFLDILRRADNNQAPSASKKGA